MLSGIRIGVCLEKPQAKILLKELPYPFMFSLS